MIFCFALWKQTTHSFFDLCGSLLLNKTACQWNWNKDCLRRLIARFSELRGWKPKAAQAYKITNQCPSLCLTGHYPPGHSYAQLQGKGYTLESHCFSEWPHQNHTFRYGGTSFYVPLSPDMPAYKPRCLSQPKCKCLFAGLNWRLSALLCGRSFPSFPSCLCSTGHHPPCYLLLSPLAPCSSCTGRYWQCWYKRSMGVGGSWHGGSWLHGDRRSYVLGRENMVADSRWRWSPAGVGLSPPSCMTRVRQRMRSSCCTNRYFMVSWFPPPKDPNICAVTGSMWSPIIALHSQGFF